jgi:hypothetical protein
MESDCTLPLTRSFCTTKKAATNNAIRIDISTSIAGVNAAAWNAVVPAEKLFLSIDYLKAFEHSTSANIAFRYLLFYKDNSPAGVAIFQILTFDGANMGMEEGAENANFSKKVLTKIVNRFSMRMLVCGNTFMTGEYGLHFNSSLSTEEQYNLLDAGIKKIVAEEKKAEGLSAVLIKDFFADSKEVAQPFTTQGYLEFKVQPNMILELDHAWKTFDDYLNAMSSKYRVRARKALKMAADIEVRQMSLQEIEQSMPRMIDLYHQIIDTTSFKMATFDLQHIPELKRAFGEEFICLGFYNNEELCGFISLYHQSSGEMVAGMMGMDKGLQKSHDLYLNILYSIVKDSIHYGAKKLVMGRTAMEIKSSLGAVPHNMYLYTRHLGYIRNMMIHPVMRRLTKTKEWHQRTPFK